MRGRQSVKHLLGVRHHNFWLPKHTSRYPYLPTAHSKTRERGNDYCGWAIYTDDGTRVVDGETLAGWSVISWSPHGRIDVMFGPPRLISLSLGPERTPTTLPI